MKEESINLTSIKKEEQTLLNNFFYISLGSFIFMFFIAVLLIAYSLILRAKIASLTSHEHDLGSQLSARANKVGQIALVNERATSIKNVLNNRDKLSGVVDALLSSIPTAFSIDKIAADDKLVSIEMVSEKLSDFDSFLESTVPAIAKKKDIGASSININSFGQDGDGYSLTINFQVNQNK